MTILNRINNEITVSALGPTFTIFAAATGWPDWQPLTGSDVDPLQTPTSSLVIWPNADGTVTYFMGTGFTYDPATGEPTGGTVTSIEHRTGIGGTLLGQGINLSNSLVEGYASLSSDAPDALESFLAYVFSGSDTITSADADNTELGGYGGDDVITGWTGGDALAGGAGDDTLNGGDGDDTLYGDDGNDILNGDADIDTASYEFASGEVTVDLNIAVAQSTGGAGSDTLSSIENLIGSNFNDTLSGTSGANVLSGGAGGDSIYGREGDDSLYGGDGSDHLWGGSGGDYFDGGADSGIDYVRYDDANWGDLTIRLDDSTLNVGAVAVGDVYVGIEGLVGGAGNDHIYGNGADNYLLGLGGVDYINGGDGNDRLDGGTGVDQLHGGLGNDIFYVDTYTDTVSETVGEGTFDQVYASATYALTWGAEVERLAVTTQTSTTAITLVGNEYGQQMLGNNGNNVLAGGAGLDSFIGYGGDDIYVVDNAAESITEIAGQGTDAVYTTVSYALAAGVSIERLVAAPLASTNSVTLTGNELAQVIVGNNGLNTIYGGAGNDSIYGMGGNDWLESAQGNDSLFGGTGVDRFVFRESLGAASGIDRIYDMTASDNIVVDAQAVSSLTSLTADQFRVGTSAADADDRIIYDAITGVFWFDADGTGAQAAILFGVINGAPAGVDHTWFELT